MKSATKGVAGARAPRPCVVLLEHAALAQHGYPVPHGHRLVDVVCDEDDGLVELLLQAQELLLEPLPGNRVDGPNGSSISRTGGSPARARATPTRCACPPESWCG